MKTLFFSVLLSVSFSCIFAQKDTSGFKNEFVGGIGTFSNADQKVGGYGFNIGLNFTKQIHRFSVAFKLNEEFVLFTSPAQRYSELNFMYGRFLKSKHFCLSGNAGFGFLSITKRGEEIPSTGGGLIISRKYREINSVTIALPVNVYAELLITKKMGVGVMAFSNFNPKDSFWGFLLNFHFAMDG